MAGSSRNVVFRVFYSAFSHCLLLALKAFSSIVPSLVELLRSGFGAMSPERGRVEFLNSWD